mgnify:CR=1 FL=1
MNIPLTALNNRKYGAASTLGPEGTPTSWTYVEELGFLGDPGYNPETLAMRVTGIANRALGQAGYQPAGLKRVVKRVRPSVNEVEREHVEYDLTPLPPFSENLTLRVTIEFEVQSTPQPEPGPAKKLKNTPNSQPGLVRLHPEDLKQLAAMLRLADLKVEQVN